MKKEGHPKYYEECKVYVGGEFVGTVGSTKPELHVDVWSGTHPFFTGQQRILDTEGQVDRFQKRLQQRSQELTDKAEKARRRRAKRSIAEIIEETPSASAPAAATADADEAAE